MAHRQIISFKRHFEIETEKFVCERTFGFRNFQLAAVYNQIDVTYSSLTQFPVMQFNELSFVG